MRVLVTAGPTREPLDPVRYLTNRSSGKMGYAMARAFAEAGHSVLLISGPTSLEVVEDVDFLPVETATDMHAAVGRHIGRMDIAVFAAAVADYTPRRVYSEKIKKDGESYILELVRTPDILGGIRSESGYKGVLVGFAAETGNLETYARDKLMRKQCDLVVANDVSRPGLGFDSDYNEVILVYPDRSVSLPADTKEHLSILIADAILAIANSRVTLHT